MFKKHKRYQVKVRDFSKGSYDFYVYPTGRRDAAFQAAEKIELRHSNLIITIEQLSRKRISIFGTTDEGVVELSAEVFPSEEKE